MSDLNNPETRQSILRARLSFDKPLVAAELAEELGISIHTVRRDLIALERSGHVRRVRGGAIALASAAPDYLGRLANPDPAITPLAQRAVRLIPNEGTVFLDSGTTVTAIADLLPAGFRGLIVTPAPSVALAAISRGARVHLIGGPLCAEGAMATGGAAEREISTIAADFCVLGACGLWPAFGLSAEDAAEAGIKRAMALASTQVLVAASAAKFHRRGRYLVLAPDEIDDLVTDASAETLRPFSEAGAKVFHV